MTRKAIHAQHLIGRTNPKDASDTVATVLVIVVVYCFATVPREWKHEMHIL